LNNLSRYSCLPFILYLADHSLLLTLIYFVVLHFCVDGMYMFVDCRYSDVLLVEAVYGFVYFDWFPSMFLFRSCAEIQTRLFKDDCISISKVHGFPTVLLTSRQWRMQTNCVTIYYTSLFFFSSECYSTIYFSLIWSSFYCFCQYCVMCFVYSFRSWGNILNFHGSLCVLQGWCFSLVVHCCLPSSLGISLSFR